MLDTPLKGSRFSDHRVKLNNGLDALYSPEIPHQLHAPNVRDETIVTSNEHGKLVQCKYRNSAAQ